MTKIRLELFQSLGGADTAWGPFAVREVNVESHTVNLISAADGEILPLVKTVQDLVLEELLSKVSIIDGDCIERVKVCLRA